jgi:hypothetical protein
LGRPVDRPLLEMFGADSAVGSNQLPAESGAGGSHECAETGDIPADEQRLDLGRSLVGDEALHVAHIAYYVYYCSTKAREVWKSSVMPLPPRTSRATRQLGERCPRFFQFSIVDQTT